MLQKLTLLPKCKLLKTNSLVNLTYFYNNRAKVVISSKVGSKNMPQTQIYRSLILDNA